jgi:hypothetical protein
MRYPAYQVIGFIGGIFIIRSLPSILRCIESREWGNQLQWALFIAGWVALVGWSYRKHERWRLRVARADEEMKDQAHRLEG